MPDLGSPLRVLIVGASGVFGSRLADLAGKESGIALTLAARNAKRLQAIAEGLAGAADCVSIDRDNVTEQDLTPYDLVVDAAGPFQDSKMQLVESAIAARVPYIDLADGRAFIAGFARYDEVAKGAQVALVTGASSIPALSHAVIDRIVAGWKCVEHLRIGIYPGNRAPRGLSVVEAILSYVGRPVRVFRDGKWQRVPGWGLTHREDVPGVGKRWASVCDTPEQDLLVNRYHPRSGAEFFAGLELGILHLGLAAFALPVRWRLIRSLRPLARPMLAIAKWFLPFGSDRGAMTIRAEGIDQTGQPIVRRWVLEADSNRGPFVPVLAALAMIRRMRDGRKLPSGAHVCSGILKLSDFEQDFVRLGMRHTLFDGAGLKIDFDTEGAARQSFAA